jgi:hypothetical protein
MDHYDLTRAASDGVYDSAELREMLATSKEIADYVERATGRNIDGAIRGGIDHILRERMLPFLSRRPKDLLRRDPGQHAQLKQEPQG